MLVYKRLRSAARRKEWLAGRYLLKYLIALEYSQDIEWKDIEILPADQKKPSIYLQNTLVSRDHSISHSDDFVISLLATNHHLKIGVDVEKIKSFPKAIDFFLTNSERNDILALPHSLQQKSLYQYWTIKEAVLKALGLGFAGSMKGIQVRMTTNMRPSVIISNQNRRIADIKTSQTVECLSHVINDYAISIAKIH